MPASHIFQQLKVNKWTEEKEGKNTKQHVTMNRTAKKTRTNKNVEKINYMKPQKYFHVSILLLFSLQCGLYLAKYPFACEIHWIKCLPIMCTAHIFCVRCSSNVLLCWTNNRLMSSLFIDTLVFILLFTNPISMLFSRVILCGYLLLLACCVFRCHLMTCCNTNTHTLEHISDYYMFPSCSTSWTSSWCVFYVILIIFIYSTCMQVIKIWNM